MCFRQRSSMSSPTTCTCLRCVRASCVPHWGDGSLGIFAPMASLKRADLWQVREGRISAITHFMSRQYQGTRKISLTSPIRHIYSPHDHRSIQARARKRPLNRRSDMNSRWWESAGPAFGTLVCAVVAIGSLDGWHSLITPMGVLKVLILLCVALLGWLIDRHFSRRR